jgi:hypothetical protein
VNHFVHERCLAVVNVGDNGDVANVHVCCRMNWRVGTGECLKSFNFPPAFKRGAKVGFSFARKKQLLSLNLLTANEFLTIIWCE